MLLQRFIGSPGREICTVVHWHSALAPSVLFCPGLTLSKAGSSFLLPGIAQRCSELGMNGILFDYLGDGDSAGTFKDVTVPSLLASAQAVVEFSQRLGCTGIGLVGWGVGNVIACYLSRDPNVDALTLLLPDFEPISRFPSLFSEDELALGQEMGYLEGDIEQPSMCRFWRAIVGMAWFSHLPLNLECLWGLTELDPIEQLLQHSKPVHVVHGEDKGSLLASVAADKEWIEYTQIPGISKMYWNEWASWSAWPKKWDKVAARTTSWLSLKLAPDEPDSAATPRSELTSTNSPVECKRHDRAGLRSLSFESDGQKVLGILHTPDSTAGGKRPCVIFEPGLGGDRVDHSRCGPRLGEWLSARGCYLLRYDSRGSGVSAGGFFEITWSRRLQDLDRALEQLAQIDHVDTDRIALLSYSAGAKVACWAANRNQSIRGSVLWSPILSSYLDPSDQAKSTRRFYRHSSGKLVTPFSGSWLGMDYFVDAREYDFAREFKECHKPTLIVLGNQEHNLVARQFIEKAVALQSKTSLFKVNDTHLFSYEVTEQVIQASVTWLADLLRF